MSFKDFRWLLPLVIVATTWGCDNAGSGAAPVEAPATRIVSLVPSATQVLVELGEASRLVGRTDHDTLPVLRVLPSVGGGLGADLEVLATLDPDLVIRFEAPSDASTPARLDDLGIRHMAVRPDGVADVLAMIREVGEAVGRGDDARALADRLVTELDAVRREVADHPPVRVAYLMGGSPPWTAGAGTYIDELITVAGGVNVFADVGGLYAAVAPEVIALRDIDVLVLSGSAEVDDRIVGARPVRRVSGDLQIPGPWLAAAARELARALHDPPDTIR